MNKGSKIAILGSALAIVGALGYQAYAADVTNGNGNGGNNMLDNAVANGIIDEQTKTNLETFNQEQMQADMSQRVKDKLSTSVTDGTITQDEADEIQAWYDAKPEALSKIKGLGVGGPEKGHGMGRFDDNDDSTDTTITESDTQSQ